MVSFGGKKKSKRTSTSVRSFPRQFFEEAKGYFGEEPKFAPEFVPLEEGGPEAYEKALFGSQESKLRTAYDRSRARRREELSQSGLLTSPVAYAEGGALDILDKEEVKDIAEAARQAKLGRLGIEEREAGRRTGFNVGIAEKILDNFFRKLALAAGASNITTTTREKIPGGGSFDFGSALGGLAGLAKLPKFLP